MNVPLYFLIPGLLALTVLILLTVFFRFRITNLRRKLSHAMTTRAEIGNFLNLFSQNIRTTSEVSDWMNVAARYVGNLVVAESVCVFTMENDSLVASGISGGFPPLRKMDDHVMTKPKYILEALRNDRIKVGEGLIGEVALTGVPLIITDSHDLRLHEIQPVIQIDSLVAVPMLSGGRVAGVLCVINNKAHEGKAFSSDQIRRLQFIAGQVVLAQNIMLVYDHLSEQQRISQELVFARSLQGSLLPKQFPAWGKFVIHAFSRASKEVSGDFYDFVEIDENRLLVVVGDACGKGVPACMIMAMTRSFIRACSARFESLKNLLQELNENLFRDTGDERYITLAVCLLDKREFSMECARAGHTELLMYVRNHIRPINPDGTALGLLPGELADFDTICMEASTDMALMLYTDGINEAVNPKGECFGTERVRETYMDSCVAEETAEEAIEAMMKAVDKFTENTENQADDQTIVIIRHI